MTPTEARRALRQADADRKAAKRKARRAATPRKVIHQRAQPTHPKQRDPRQRDKAFLAWLHDDIPCIACEIEGGDWGAFMWCNTGYAANPIEAAHQNLAIASKGWRERGLGKRIHDLGRTVPLCRWHHTGAPNACDCGQRQFWDRMGLGDRIADLCADLATAFTTDTPGAAVVARYSSGNGDET